MRIVVLDGYTMNPGDLDMDPLMRLGECEIHDRTDQEDVLQRIGTADVIVLTNKTVLDAEIINALPNLKYIGVLATGYNVVDLEAARAKGIVVTNVPAYSTSSVVQMVFALLLELTQKVALHDKLVRKGRWEECPDFSFTAMPLLELEGKTMGIVGYGTIGRRVAQVARSFGMNILVYTANPEKYQRDTTVRFIDLDNLFGQSDVISLHCPLTPETENLVNEERITLMKKSAILINTGRGQLVDEWALSDALDAKQIAGAGIDVLSEEPPRTHHPLIGATNCFVTPHIAWATREARMRLLAIAVENIKAFIDGEPINVVS
ncbi:MAG: glycerate dehydrogenase [Desulfuromonas sp.]|nr:MAG: glycerate dehydrogenase [Desulfuromonas sp.]